MRSGLKVCILFIVSSQRLQKTIIVLFHLLFMTVPFFFTWVNEELFEFPKMLLTYGFAVLIAGFWAGRMILERKPLVRRTVFDWPILFFVISQLLSTIFSIHPATSIMGYYTRFHGGLLSTFTYTLLFYALVSNFSKPALKRLWLTIFIAALGVTIYAIPEHFGHSPSCLLITKEFSVSCWVQDVKSRVFATFGQPNWLAAYTITLIPLGISLFAQTKKRWQQIIFSLTTITLFITLLFTQSRSGLIGFGASMIVFGAGLVWLQRQHKKKKSFFTKSLGLIGAIGVTLILVGSNFTPSISKIVKSNQPSPAPSQPAPVAVVNRLETGGTDSGEIRKIVWQGAINIWKRYPLLGSGVETFAYSYYQDRTLAHNLVSEWDFLYNKAHNELLNFLATTGIVGLGSYLLLLGWFGVISLRAILNLKNKINLKDRAILLSLLSGIIALSLSSFLGFSTVVVSILLFTSLGSTAILTASERVSPEAKTSSPSTAQIIQLTILTILVLFMTSKIFNVWKADREFAAGKSYINAGYANEGLEKLQAAIKLRPKEALFHDQLANAYSKVAVALEQQGQSDSSTQFEKAALEESALTLQLNPRHLNFYKSRTRILITLAAIDPSLLIQARETLVEAIKLAPTDAKLMYNLGLIEISSDQVETGIKTLEKTVEMKPNYEAARVALGKQYESQQQASLALEQYQYIYDHITQDNQEINQKITKLK
jgi:putative inorganic carbon (hco3(-)) transporter